MAQPYSSFESQSCNDVASWMSDAVQSASPESTFCAETREIASDVNPIEGYLCIGPGERLTVYAYGQTRIGVMHQLAEALDRELPKMSGATADEPQYARYVHVGKGLS